MNDALRTELACFLRSCSSTCKTCFFKGGKCQSCGLDRSKKLLDDLYTTELKPNDKHLTLNELKVLIALYTRTLHAFPNEPGGPLATVRGLRPYQQYRIIKHLVKKGLVVKTDRKVNQRLRTAQVTVPIESIERVSQIVGQQFKLAKPKTQTGEKNHGNTDSTGNITELRTDEGGKC